ncbi:MAG TPA: DUF2946 family protein [Stellaceae bacterium]|nr:DUF2946 family protein [Stellaceae bacterium]
MRRSGVLQSGVLKGMAGGLAVFALWVQLALGFGHLHATDVFGPLGQAVTAGQGPDRVSAQRPGQDEGAAGLPGADADADGCAICATLHLAAGAAPTPCFAPPEIAKATRLGPLAERTLAVTAPDYLLSRPRAPPIA